MKLNATKKGLITGCVMVALQFFFIYGLKLPIDNNPYGFITYFVYAIGLAWSMLALASRITNDTKFSECFSNGFKTFVPVVLLMVVFTFVFYTMHPEIRNAEIEQNTQRILQDPHQTHTMPEIIDNAKQVKAIFLPGKLAGATFLYLFLGAIMTIAYSLILLQKKKK